ncbi:hypothetical protein AGDE_15528 [Angomonas deanei]|uniref:Uncharacterized protein n=1 Tax=Angomonas deanei TaxID=59799 RepID=A0A7G2CNT2_9TRYP|nr:hypothetical protein AGDE_15528 [Angomonas deanei]CAD2221508.1 hypothetical protein, conserved [Angomonas deanei]|eukprot:EPY18916.1 hypothetical protein AGDE_15528 [Angomonas deanei]
MKDVLPREHDSNKEKEDATITNNENSGTEDIIVNEDGAKEASTALPHKDTSDLSAELHHPGRVFLLTHPWDPNLNRLVEVPRGHVIMHEIFLMKLMFELHLIDNYTAGLRVIRSREEVEQYLAK